MREMRVIGYFRAITILNRKNITPRIVGIFRNNAAVVRVIKCDDVAPGVGRDVAVQPVILLRSFSALFALFNPQVRPDLVFAAYTQIVEKILHIF